VASGRLDKLTLAASAVGAEVVQQKVLSLDDIFLARVGAPSTATEEAAP
jgi:hypothetical protein